MLGIRYICCTLHPEVTEVHYQICVSTQNCKYHITWKYQIWVAVSVTCLSVSPFCFFEDVSVKSENMTSEVVITKEMEEEENQLMEEGERKEREMMEEVFFPFLIYNKFIYKIAPRPLFVDWSKYQKHKLFSCKTLSLMSVFNAHCKGSGVVGEGYLWHAPQEAATLASEEQHLLEIPADENGAAAEWGTVWLRRNHLCCVWKKKLY